MHNGWIYQLLLEDIYIHYFHQHKILMKLNHHQIDHQFQQQLLFPFELFLLYLCFDCMIPVFVSNILFDCEISYISLLIWPIYTIVKVLQNFLNVQDQSKFFLNIFPNYSFWLCLITNWLTSNNASIFYRVSLEVSICHHVFS